MTVESNHAITLVLALVGFLIGSERWWVIPLPIGSKKGVNVGLIN